MMKQNGLNQVRMSRRGFLRWLAGLLLSSSARMGYGRLLEPRWVDVEYVTLHLPDLPLYPPKSKAFGRGMNG